MALPDDRREWTTSEVEAYAAGVRAAAALIDCGCEHRDAALRAAAAGDTAARWRACGVAQCSAIEAAAILALLPEGAPARDTHGEA